MKQQNPNLIRKYYPFSGKRSPYIIMSAEEMAETNYIKYSNDLTRIHGDRHYHHTKENYKTWKILIIVCLGLTMTVLIHQCINLGKFYPNNQRYLEEIVIITKESNNRVHDFENNGILTKSKADDDGIIKKDDESKCIPGTTKMQNCNTCRCLEGGIYACTKMACATNGIKSQGLNLGIDEYKV